MKVDLYIDHAAQIVTCTGPGPKRGAAMAGLAVIRDGALAVDDGKIVAVGFAREMRGRFDARERIDASGRAVVPGLIDCHTHAVWAGDRVDEFERRLIGESYLEIMAKGGGIVSTMRAVREASLEELVAATLPRLAAMLRLGTTTAEVKTGYGLNTAAELKMLQAVERLDRCQSIELVPTFLGAHAVPPEYRGDSPGYATKVMEEMLPQVQNWYRSSGFAGRGIPLFNDVFCEKNAFSLEQSRRILEKGLALGLSAKIHADEFTCMGGVKLAVDLGAVSVDHLDVTGEQDRKILAGSNTVGVVLPAVNLNLGSTSFADARNLIDADAALALATDFNPGSAPCPSLALVMALSCRYQHLSPAEALTATTLNAAYAIGLEKRVGSLEPGKQADLLILDGPDYRQLAFQLGGNGVQTVVKKGQVV